MKNLTWVSAIIFSAIILACSNTNVCSYDESSNTLSCPYNEYRTVKTGGNIWMKDNLNSFYSDQSYCYNGDKEKCKVYGRLYKFDAARILCPEGWRLPSENEFRKANMDSLDIKLAGFGYYDNSYVDEGVSASFWTSDSYDTERATLVRISDSITYEHFNKSLAASARCIKKN